MTAFVALLRAVNVGGKAKLAMVDLRSLASDTGLNEPATLLQSGNLLFKLPDGGRTGEIETRLEAALADRLGLRTDVVVRGAGDWSRLIATNPFAKLAVDDPSHLVLMPLKAAAREEAEAGLRRVIKGREEVVVRGDAAYVAYPDGIGTSKLTMQVLERHLGTMGTGRNWNTALKIAAALVSQPEPTAGC